MPELEHRLVLDQTGLKGNYTLTLQWTPISMSANGGEAYESAATAGASGARFLKRSKSSSA